jgi:hypothetical protein
VLQPCEDKVEVEKAITTRITHTREIPINPLTREGAQSKEWFMKKNTSKNYKAVKLRRMMKQCLLNPDFKSRKFIEGVLAFYNKYGFITDLQRDTSLLIAREYALKKLHTPKVVSKPIKPLQPKIVALRRRNGETTKLVKEITKQ